jgi:hypothetical protein
MRNILFSLLLLSGGAIADEKKAEPKKAEAKPAAAAPAAKGDKITGEVVDITCFANHDARGDKHAACAAKCLSAGMPAGIVSGGKLYVVTMKDHTAPSAKLAAWAGKEVTANGSLVDKDGLHIFEIDTVEPAAAPAPAKK